VLLKKIGEAVITSELPEADLQQTLKGYVRQV
jgi:hypothetical protein